MRLDHRHGTSYDASLITIPHNRERRATHATEQVVEGLGVDQLLMRLPQLPEVTTPVGVETASRSDAPALSRLLSAAFEQPWDEKWVVDNLFADESVVATFVLRGPDSIAATASARLLPEQFPESGYVHFVATAPEARGRGLGGQATQAVLAAFAARGLRQAVLETDDGRLGAISLYLGLGFVPEYRNPEHVLRWSSIFSQLAGGTSHREVRG